MDETIQELYNLIDSIPVTDNNKDALEEIKEAIDDGDLQLAFQKLNNLPATPDNDMDNIFSDDNSDNKKKKRVYPQELSNEDLEFNYIGKLLGNPEAIVKFYFLFKDCYFENLEVLNLYKRVLFTDGEAYAPEIAKKGYNFSRETEDSYNFEQQMRYQAEDAKYELYKAYVELRKLFLLRKTYLEIPIKNIQDRIVEISNYRLYDQMTIEEVAGAIDQVNATTKFKQAILNEDLTSFLQQGDNNLTNGLDYPFPIITNVFKGIRKGEITAFAMPSNSGKSRFTINVAAYTAFVHKKKVLIISNEMSEEKMKLCLITTIINNPEIQKIHGQVLSKTEGELLEFKFRPDDPKSVEVDEKGFIIKKEKESQKDFIKRLSNFSSEFNKTIAVTNWVNKEMKNSIYFINITDHTNDELKKVIMNYYYKEKIEYMFYDTLKTDVENIGIGEELKKTTTILSNLAQNFNLFIFTTLQLVESGTLPINLTINDLSASKTVKEVLDTLCLIKQISRQNLKDYQYSLNEVDTNFFDLEEFKDPDVRYYSCVVDKNRAGAKPKLVFRLNLAYNSWEELGYLHLKQDNIEK